MAPVDSAAGIPSLASEALVLLLLLLLLLLLPFLLPTPRVALPLLSPCLAAGHSVHMLYWAQSQCCECALYRRLLLAN